MKNDFTEDRLVYKYSIKQSKGGYRFSIDPIVLGSFVKEKDLEGEILEVGVGCGVLSILLGARLKNGKLSGIEIQESLFDLALLNIKRNKINMTLTKGDFKGMRERDFYHTLVANPPFFCEGEGIISKNIEIAKARHEIELNLKDFFLGIKRVLKTKGVFYMIYPSDKLGRVFLESEKNDLHIKDLIFIHGNVEKESALVLIRGFKGKRGELKIHTPLYIYDLKGGYTKRTDEILKGGIMKW